MKNKTKFQVGEAVHVDCDHPDWGRVASDGCIVEVDERGFCLVQIDALRAVLSIPNNEIFSQSSIDPDRSVNCFFCSALVDERDCVPNIEEGGSICPKCQKVREKMKHTYVLILSRVNPSDGQPQIYHTFVFADSDELMALDGEAKDLACGWRQVPRAIITDVIPFGEYTPIENVLAEAQKQWDGE